MFDALADEDVMGSGFQHPIAHTLFPILLTQNRLVIFSLRRVAMTGQNTLVKFDLWNRPGKVHIGGLVAGTHLRRDAAHTYVEGKSKSPSEPER